MALKTGRFSSTEDKFLQDNHKTMTDAQMGTNLNRDPKSITNRRKKLNLQNPRSKPRLTQGHREAYVATLDDKDREKFFEKEVLSSSRYRSLKKSLSTEECKYYVEKYVEFMVDPTIETMTAMEKDTLHQMLISEMMIQRYMREMKNNQDRVESLLEAGKIKPNEVIPFSRSREIKDAQDIISKCQASLMVERKQRLKDQSDQSVTFTNLIKELKDPRNRFRLGAEAAMLKIIAEQTYNTKLGKNIRSGNDKSFDMASNFRKGEVPELPEEFLPSVEQENDGLSSTNDSQGHKRKT